ncbi:MAG: hypothetical protein KGD64_01930 [Candidatus Heimdallarchaeota archaeon]|nr:hypothetical protein [Candidatus Heimdallarchaeota archaeon]
MESNNSLDPLVEDASVDLDNDTLTNLEEYNYNTDPIIMTQRSRWI